MLVGVTEGAPIVITIVLTFAPEPQLQVYVPPLNPIPAIVCVLYVIEPLITVPETYPGGTTTSLGPLGPAV